MGFVSCISDALHDAALSHRAPEANGCRLLVTKMFSRAAFVDYVGGNHDIFDRSAA